ncbi:threonine-phosphate decarboxylase [Anopheles sinensis]|uniref:Threonine-phosphate decarboxylase n=1 Tax=Anopheles sinensis TaxID=74873 RepID=A0A084W4R5_ANOSI|nr:threonine-phosphate decarboxylase [Anopheles sinensis]
MQPGRAKKSSKPLVEHQSLPYRPLWCHLERLGLTYPHRFLHSKPRPSSYPPGCAIGSNRTQLKVHLNWMFHHPSPEPTYSGARKSLHARGKPGSVVQIGRGSGGTEEIFQPTSVETFVPAHQSSTATLQSRSQPLETKNYESESSTSEKLLAIQSGSIWFSVLAVRSCARPQRIEGAIVVIGAWQTS